MFALINDWEDNIAYWEESKESEASTNKCDSFYCKNWWVWGQAAQPQKNFEIYTFIYVYLLKLTQNFSILI